MITEPGFASIGVRTVQETRINSGCRANPLEQTSSQKKKNDETKPDSLSAFFPKFSFKVQRVLLAEYIIAAGIHRDHGLVVPFGNLTDVDKLADGGSRINPGL